MSAKVHYVSGVSEARDWANAMVLREMRSPGDIEGAMRRLEGRYGIPWRTFWALRYRAPKDVLVGVYRQLLAAYENECERQERLLQHERAITEAKVLAAENLLRSSSASDRSEGDA